MSSITAREAWRPLPACGDTTRAGVAAGRVPGPFPYGFVDDYLPEDLLADLEAGFLDPAGHENLQVLGKGKKRLMFRAPPVPDFVSAAGPAWVEAVRAVSAPDFLEPTWQWVRAVLADTPTPGGPYDDLLAERLSLGVDDLLVQLEFSSLEAGAYLPPHTDAADKVLSCVFYLPQPDWDPGWGGVTEIFDPAAGLNWNNRIGSRDDLSPIGGVPFTRNRMFWFLKTADSWHGVSPVSAPAGIGRRSFNVSVAIRPEALTRPTLAEAARRVAESEGWPPATA